MMNYLKAFLAGFASTLIFHQGLIAFLHAVGFIPRVPYSFAPTAPFGIPQVVSLAFWGGVWGIPLWLAIRRKGVNEILVHGAALRGPPPECRCLVRGVSPEGAAGCRRMETVRILWRLAR